MKKIIILISTFTFLFVSGCSLQKDGKVESLKDAYFYILEKNKDDEFKIYNLKALLKIYDIEETENKESESKKYIFSKDENEKLSITTKIENINKTESIESLTYNFKKNDDSEDNTTVTDISLIYENNGDTSKLKVACDTNSINVFEYVSNAIDDKESSFLKIYNEVVKDMLTKNNLTLENIRLKTDEKPLIKNYTENFGNANEFKMTRYLYTNKNENMTINYINSEKRVGRTIYTKLDKDSNPLLIKSSHIKSINNNDISLSIVGYTKDIEIQENLISKVIKR